MRDIDLLQLWLKGVIGGISKGGCPACSRWLGTRTSMGLMRLLRVAVLLEPCTCTAVVRLWATNEHDVLKARHHINGPEVDPSYACKLQLVR